MGSPAVIQLCGGPARVGKPQGGGAATLAQLTGPADQYGELHADFSVCETQDCQDES